MAGISLETNKKDGAISFSGKTEDNDILAVSCALLDKDKNEIELISVAVNGNTFSGEFLSSEGVEVECDDYDSESDDGKVSQRIVEEVTEVAEEQEETQSVDSADTGVFRNEDMSFVVGTSLTIFLVVGLGALVFFLMRRTNKKA